MQTIFFGPGLGIQVNLSNKIIFLAEKKILTLITGDIVAFVILNV